MGYQLLGCLACFRHAQRDQVGVDPVFAEDRAHRANRNGGGQNGVFMRFDDDRIARGQRRKQTGIGVPGWEGAASDHHRHTAPNHFKVLLHAHGRVFALWLFPQRLRRHKALLTPGIGNRFQAAILCVGRAGLECHHPGLPGSHHDRVGNFKALLVESIQHFNAHAGSPLRACGLPGWHGLLARVDQ